MRIVKIFTFFLFLSLQFLAGNDERRLLLADFSVVQNGSKTDIKWSLNREPFGTYFTIEKSTDGKNFNKVVDQPVAENGNLYEEYFETDYQPYKGVSYYRVKQTNEAGEVFCSEPVAFKYSEESSQRLAAALPKDDASLNTAVKSAEGRETLFILRDADGNDYYSKIDPQLEDNYMYVSKDNANLPQGIYRIVGTSNNQLYSLKLIIK